MQGEGGILAEGAISPNTPVKLKNGNLFMVDLVKS